MFGALAPDALLLLGQFCDARTGVQLMTTSKDARSQHSVRLSLTCMWAAQLRAEMLAENASLRLARDHQTIAARSGRAVNAALIRPQDLVLEEYAQNRTLIIAENREVLSQHAEMLAAYNRVHASREEVLDENDRYRAELLSISAELAQVRQSLS